MHELSMALNILDLAAEHAQRHGGGRVTAIHVRLGPLAGVVKEALQSAYGLVRPHSVLTDANLVIEEVPLTAYCPHCAVERILPALGQFACPVCAAPTSEIVRGRELEIVALEMEA